MLKVRITKETRIRVLAFQGQEREYYEGVPEAWIECFGAENEDDPNMPTFNRILYLRNVNFCPAGAGIMTNSLPIWHAGVITFMDETPVTLLLISTTELMDKLVREHPPAIILKRLYPEAEIGEIRTDLIDAEEEPMTNLSNDQCLNIVLDGWPDVSWRENYLQTQCLVEMMSRTFGGKPGRSGIEYSLKLRGVEIQLNFVHFRIEPSTNSIFWVHRDEIFPIQKISDM